MTAEIEPRRLVQLADEIRTEVDAAEADFRSAVQHAIRAGELLMEAKGQVKHGEWLPWLGANVSVSERQARNYMRLARNRQRVADLPSIREAIAALTAPVEAKPEQLTPEDARKLTDEVRDDLARLRAKKIALAEYLSANGDRLGAAKLYIEVAESYSGLPSWGFE